MKLEKKKALAARTLNVGKNRILFNTQMLAEIKEAITKQDIKTLKNSGAITLKETKGKRKVQKRKTRRRDGSIKKKLNTRKRDYINLTRKLRNHLSTLKKKEKLSNEEFIQLRKEIRSSNFRSLAHMKERIANLSGEKK